MGHFLAVRLHPDRGTALVALSGRAKSGAILGLALVCLWQLWIGAARPHSIGSPAGEAGLCLALMAWWCGASAGLGGALWAVCLLSGSLVSGIPPLWAFLIGWPAWLLVRTLAHGQRFGTFLALAVGLVSLLRCGGKLLLLASPGLHSPLTLSGGTLAGSLLAEVAPNLVWLAAFAALLGAGPRAEDSSTKLPL